MPSWATPLPTPLFSTPCFPPPLAACLLFISKTFTSYKICWGWAPKDKQMLREGGSKKWGLPKFVYPVVFTDCSILFYELQTAGFGGYIFLKGYRQQIPSTKIDSILWLWLGLPIEYAMGALGPYAGDGSLHKTHSSCIFIFSHCHTPTPPWQMLPQKWLL